VWRTDAVADRDPPGDNEISKKLMNVQRIVLDALCIQLIPVLRLAIDVAPFAN
jgi:hypothetical protein